MTIRVLNITSSPFATGGVETLLLQMHEERGTLLAPTYCNLFFPQSTFIEALRQKGAAVTAIGDARVTSLPFVIRELVRHIRSEQPDVVHTHMIHGTIVGQIAAAIARAPVRIATRHHFDTQVSMPLCLLEHQVIRRATRVIAVSKAIAADLIRGGVKPEKIAVIHNGVMMAAIDAAVPAPTVPWPEAWNEAMLIGTVGNLYGYKGHAALIEAFAYVVRERDDARLVIIGDGEERENLLGVIAALNLNDRIAIVGRQSDVPALLRRLRIYVQPSLQEPFGIAVLEAMAARLPIVSTTAGGLTEIVIDEETGLLVPPGDVTALATAIVRLASDIVLREKLANLGRHRVQDCFTIQSTVTRTVGVYRDGLTEHFAGDHFLAS